MQLHRSSWSRDGAPFNASGRAPIQFMPAMERLASSSVPGKQLREGRVTLPIIGIDLVLDQLLGGGGVEQLKPDLLDLGMIL
ncbi:hypothetical protein QYF36_022384 [Acer negundo]|nr:hypothetical protein QYF36_022384 [Acer negundo]